MKKYFKRDNECKCVEEVGSIKDNMRYVYHYHFISVTTFDFLGDITVEESNCGLKRGDVTVSTNMNIDISAMTQM